MRLGADKLVLARQAEVERGSNQTGICYQCQHVYITCFERTLEMKTVCRSDWSRQLLVGTEAVKQEPGSDDTNIKYQVMLSQQYNSSIRLIPSTIGYNSSCSS